MNALRLALLAPLLLLGRDAAAQKDPCVPPPLLPKFDRATIESCRVRAFDERAFRDVTKAGRVQELELRHPNASGAKLMKTLEETLTKAGFERVHESSETPFTQAAIFRRAAAPELWIEARAETLNEGEFTESRFVILEVGDSKRRLQPPSAKAPKGVKDAAKCRDFDFIGRMEGARIEECSALKDQPPPPILGQLTEQRVRQGDVATVAYGEADQTSAREAALVYETALKATGWETLERVDTESSHVLFLRKEDAKKAVYLMLVAESLNGDAFVKTTLSTFTPTLIDVGH